MNYSSKLKECMDFTKSIQSVDQRMVNIWDFNRTIHANFHLKKFQCSVFVFKYQQFFLSLNNNETGVSI